MSVAERLVTRLAERSGPSRRTFVAGATLGGAALAMNPWGFLTRPQDAYSSVCGPGAECNDGWSAMCCSINDGKNTCPPNTFPGGWWKADRSSYCGGEARYYIDCNADPDSNFTCQCNKTNCDHRRVACNVFRYGQCNTQVEGVTAVVCRQISCRPPWQLYPEHCGHSSATDNATAQHTAPCLTKRNTYPVLEMFPHAPHRLEPGHLLKWRHRLTSLNRHTTLTFTEHGNLAIFNQDGKVWSAGTGAKGGHAKLRHSGEFVVINKRGREVWSTGTARDGAKPLLKLQNDGNLVLFDHGHSIWSSHTHTP